MSSDVRNTLIPYTVLSWKDKICMKTTVQEKCFTLQHTRGVDLKKNVFKEECSNLGMIKISEHKSSKSIPVYVFFLFVFLIKI